jgi:hypothetical protein
MPQETAATFAVIGSSADQALRHQLVHRERSATHAPEIEAVRVPPSAWITSQSR